MDRNPARAFSSGGVFHTQNPGIQKKGVDAMMHRINIKDTPRLLEISLQPPEILDDTFWIVDDSTNVIFESTQDESMPEKNSGKL